MGQIQIVHQTLMHFHRTSFLFAKMLLIQEFLSIFEGKRVYIEDIWEQDCIILVIGVKLFVFGLNWIHTFMWKYIVHLTLVLTLEINEMKGMVFWAMIMHCEAILGQGQSRLMRWILVWIIPQVQDQSLNLLICSPVPYHCATAAPQYLGNIYLCQWQAWSQTLIGSTWQDLLFCSFGTILSVFFQRADIFSEQPFYWWTFYAWHFSTCHFKHYFSQ